MPFTPHITCYEETLRSRLCAGFFCIVWIYPHPSFSTLGRGFLNNFLIILLLNSYNEKLYNFVEKPITAIEESIPDNAMIVLLPDYDSLLAEKNRELAEANKEPGQAIVYVKVKKLRASKIEDLSLQVAWEVKV